MQAFPEGKPVHAPSMLAPRPLTNKRSQTGSTTPQKARTTYDFGSIADKYDAWYWQPVGRVYDVLEKNAVSKVLPDPAQGDRLLEVGCGTGHWSAFFAERGFRVIGMDISHRMIEAARRKAIRDAVFRQADAAAIPFPSRAFDVAAAITLLEFVPDPREVLDEMARCVRGGGCIVVGVLNRWSYQGIVRKIRQAPLFRSAKFFSVRSLRRLLSEYGRAQVRSAACFLPRRWALGAAPALDRAASAIGLPFGDFLAGRVQL